MVDEESPCSRLHCPAPTEVTRNLILSITAIHLVETSQHDFFDGDGNTIAKPDVLRKTK